MEGVDLRPLSLGELLDRTFSVYRNHFWLFVGIMVLPQFAGVAVQLGMEGFFGPVRVAPQAAPAPNVFLSGIAGALGRAGITLVIFWIMYSFGLGATTLAVSEVYLGKPANVRGSYAMLRGRLWQLIDVVFSVLIRVFGFYALTALAVIAVTGIAFSAVGRNPILAFFAALVVFAGILFALALAVWMALRYAVAIPALLLENCRAGEAIKRSVVLTRGHRGRAFLILLLMLIITWAIVLLFQGPFMVPLLILAKRGSVPLWLQSLATLFGGAGGALTGPLLMIALSLLYYDLRVRKEAFDLQMMVAALGPAGSEAQPAGASPSAAGSVSLPRLPET